MTVVLTPRQAPGAPAVRPQSFGDGTTREPGKLSDRSYSELLELVRAEGDAMRGRLSEGLRQVKAAVGAGGVSMVVEVAPWSRIPEARALLVPRDD